jgi:predicted nucleic acid-binding protein
MFAIDTNLLVYAHNTASPFNRPAKTFLEQVMNTRNAEGQLAVCFPAQVFLEFVHIITWERLEAPLSLPQALQIVREYVDTGVRILTPQPTYIQTFLELSQSVTTRKKVFDIAIAATLKDNGIQGLYTANPDDFKQLDFLDVINPIKNPL